VFGCCTSALDFLLYALDDVSTEKVTTFHSYRVYWVGEGHMGDGHVWMLAGSATLLIDISNYGIKEWLQLIAAAIAIFVSVIGAWRTYRYSKSQIAKRLMEYLEDEKTRIKDSRNRIIGHLRLGRPPNGGTSHDFYRDVKAVLDGLASRDPRTTEKQLKTLESALAGDIDVGQKHISNANLKLATLLLVRGKSANERSETTEARAAWETALKCYSHDAEAERYLGELALAEGDEKKAVKHFGQAYSFAPDDKLLRAETWEIIGDYYQQQGRPMLELKALVACAPNFAGAKAYDRAARACRATTCPTAG
jgi:tetratricopeptide (TPR) repeat protein